MSLGEVMRGEDRAIMGGDRADYRVMRQIRLDNHLARRLSPAGASRNLLEQVVGTLLGAEVRHLEGIVRIDKA